MTTALLPRRDSGTQAGWVEVRSQDELLALPAGALPVLRGDAVYALGHGSAAVALDAVRVCAVEGARVRAGDHADVHVWEGGAVAADGAVQVTVGRGGRAWVVSDTARLACRPAPAGMVTELADADLEAVLHGRSTAWVEGGRLIAGGGAHVDATGRAVLVLDSTVAGRDVEGRQVVLEQGPLLAPPDLDAVLDAHRAGEVARRVPTPLPDRLVLAPWTPADPTELLEPVVVALEQTGARRDGGWGPSRTGSTLRMRGRADWAGVRERLSVPSCIALWDGPDGPRVVTDVGVEVRIAPAGLLSRLRRP